MLWPVEIAMSGAMPLYYLWTYVFVSSTILFSSLKHCLNISKNPKNKNYEKSETSYCNFNRAKQMPSPTTTFTDYATFLGHGGASRSARGFQMFPWFPGSSFINNTSLMKPRGPQGVSPEVLWHATWKRRRISGILEICWLEIITFKLWTYTV